MSYRNDNSLFNSLLAKEQRFLQSEFLAPVCSTSGVSVKIAGVLVNLRVSPASFSGWGIFTTKDSKVATLSREATLLEKARYIELFPVLAFMICDIHEGIAYGRMIHERSGLNINGVVPILLADNIEVFDVVFGAFNGRQIWYVNHNNRFNRRTIRELRDALEVNTPNKDLKVSGINQNIRSVYSDVLNRKIQAEIDSVELRVQSAIHRAGGQFLSYRKQGASLRVDYTVGGRRCQSLVDDNLRVQSAGICLDGTDANFDLQSLVGVIREGEERNLIYEVGL